MKIKEISPISKLFVFSYSLIKIYIKSLKSSENVLRKNDGQDKSFLNNKFISVTHNELAVKARECVTVQL